MTTTLAVENIKMTVPELLDSLAPGDEVILTRNQQAVARLVAQPPVPPPQRPGPGLCKGMITIVAEDDEHLKDFAEYM